MNRPRYLRTLVLLLTCVSLGLPAAYGRTLVKNICRVKGQEENTLHGLGLVTGLKGTGDSGDYAPMIRSMARA